MILFGVKVGVLIHPTRLATTGNPNGPSLYHLLEVALPRIGGQGWSA